MIWVRVQRNHLPLQGVKDKLVQKCVVGFGETLNILIRHSDLHLQVLTDLLYHLYV